MVREKLERQMIETWHEMTHRHAAERKSALSTLAGKGKTVPEAAEMLDVTLQMVVAMSRNLGVSFRRKATLKEPANNLKYLRKLSKDERSDYNTLREHYDAKSAMASIGRSDLIGAMK